VAIGLAWFWRRGVVVVGAGSDIGGTVVVAMSELEDEVEVDGIV
jgi:hypothetical protein